MFHSENIISNDDDEPEPNFATGVKLAASETKEIEIPVTRRFALFVNSLRNTEYFRDFD